MGKFRAVGMASHFIKAKIFYQKDGAAIDKRKYLNSFPYSVIVLFLITLYPITLTAQVIIKEKVEINPQSTITPDSPVQGHTVRVDLEWTPANVPGSIIFYDLFCTTPSSSASGTSSTGALSFSHTKIGYEYYNIQFRFYPCTLFPYPQPHNIQGTSKIYYDDRLMRTIPFQIQGVCGTYDINTFTNTAFRPPLITEYQFDITQDNFCKGSSGNIYIKGSTPNCSNPMEIDTSLNKTVKLEILNGKEYVSFYQDGIAKDTATVRYDNIDYWNINIKGIDLQQDNQYLDQTPLEVIVKSDWAGEIRLDTITIMPQSPTTMYITNTQPNFVYDGRSAVAVNAYSSYSSSVCWTEMPDSVKYRAVITKGQNLGNLVDYSTGYSGDILINLDHTNGQRVIGFETEGENLTEQDTVIVSISTTDPNINTLQAMFIIMPGDINVQIIPGTISQGDTARVDLKKNGQNGLEDFPADKLFNVEIINGMEYGLVLDSLSNDTLTTFENILQGFKIIAKDSTGIDSTKIRIKVTTEADDVLPTAKLTRDNTQLNTTERTQTKNNDDETILPNIGIILPGPTLIEGFGDVVVEDGCDEEIVVCNNYQPPKFEDVGTITVLKSDTTWQWIDKQGIPQTTNTGDACNFDVRQNRIDFGKTYIMPSVGNFSSSIPPDPVYNLLDDLEVLVCLDNNDPTKPVWQYSVDNLRVPIFSDVCYNIAQQNGFIDLGDGTDANLLTQNIKDCIDYDNVIKTLEWWKKGPYHQYRASPPYQFYFSAGIEAHEEVHRKQLIDGGTTEYKTGTIKQEMNGEFGLPFLSLIKQVYSLDECPNDALLKSISFQGNQEIIKDFIKEKVMISAIVRASELLTNSQFHPTWKERKCEVEADELARWKYDEIKVDVENWAKQQSWWCNETFGGNFDCFGNKCNP